MKISAYYLISYDYAMFMTSVKQLYDYVDKIVLAIDSERKTFKGNVFHIPDSFFDEVKKFDVKNKIEFYFDIFYLPELSPMELETRERNLTLAKLGRGWKIQIDVDEYVYEFEKVKTFLKKQWYYTIFPSLTPVCYTGTWITLFKKNDDGFFYIENDEKFPMITNLSKVKYARMYNKSLNHSSNIKVVHQSWAREEDEVLQKLLNWSHSNDFDVLKLFSFWKKLNSRNYRYFENFHPLSPNIWNSLYFLKSNSIDEFIIEYSTKNKQVLNPLPTKKIFKIAIKKILGRK